MEQQHMQHSVEGGRKGRWRSSSFDDTNERRTTKRGVDRERYCPCCVNSALPIRSRRRERKKGPMMRHLSKSRTELNPICHSLLSKLSLPHAGFLIQEEKWKWVACEVLLLHSGFNANVDQNQEVDPGGKRKLYISPQSSFPAMEVYLQGDGGRERRVGSGLTGERGD